MSPFLYHLKIGSMVLFTHNVQNIKDAAHKNDDIDCIYKPHSPLEVHFLNYNTLSFTALFTTKVINFSELIRLSNLFGKVLLHLSLPFWRSRTINLLGVTTTTASVNTNTKRIQSLKGKVLHDEKCEQIQAPWLHINYSLSIFILLNISVSTLVEIHK